MYGCWNKAYLLFVMVIAMLHLCCPCQHRPLTSGIAAPLFFFRRKSVQSLLVLVCWGSTFFSIVGFDTGWAHQNVKPVWKQRRLHRSFYQGECVTIYISRANDLYSLSLFLLNKKHIQTRASGIQWGKRESKNFLFNHKFSKTCFLESVLPKQKVSCLWGLEDL